MCSRNCCNMFWSILLVVGLVATLAAPWYFVDMRFEKNNEQCNVVRLYSWRQMYCRSNCDSIPCEHSKTNWRDACGENDARTCTHMEQVYDISLAFTVFSLFCGIVTIIGFLTRWCSPGSPKSKLHMFFTFLGLVLLFLGVVVFAAHFPKALDKDKGGDVTIIPNLCASNLPGVPDGPCHKFFGDAKIENSSILPGLDRYAWGGAGWIAGLITLVIYIINVCLACSGGAVAQPVQHQDVVYGSATSYQPVSMPPQQYYQGSST